MNKTVTPEDICEYLRGKGTCTLLQVADHFVLPLEECRALAQQSAGVRVLRPVNGDGSSFTVMFRKEG